jgi:hypothetical protein
VPRRAAGTPICGDRFRGRRWVCCD